MVSGSRLGLTVAVIAALLVGAPAASAAVKSGRYKGTDISFKVKGSRVSNIKVVATYSCQRIGTGELPDGEVRQVTVPGTLSVTRKGKLIASRYIGTYGDIRDITFEWKGEIRGRNAKVFVQSGYNYSSYSAQNGFVLVKCFSQTTLKAKRQ